MNFLIIIPAHNEENNIFFCLKSLQQQTHRGFRVVVVNDGSTDDTSKIAEEFALKYPNFEVLNLEKSAHEPGAKVVRTFNKGLAFAGTMGADIICKFDADIIFPTNYLSEINRVFEGNSRSGMVSGIVKIRKSTDSNDSENEIFNFDNDEQWKFENISSKNHVRGPIKAYRRQCFEDMNGLRPVLGWDNIDVMLAKMHGWEIVTLKELWVKHLRPTAYKYKTQKAEKLGEYFYNIGLNFPLAAISSAKSAWKNRSVKEFFITMKNFAKQTQNRQLSSEEIQYIRNLRTREMFKKLNF